MCEFISWVEKRGKVKFLTGKIIQSEKFIEIAQKRGIASEDYNGHGAIRAYFGIDEGDGIDREMADFSTPDNFPPIIVQAIKRGDMRGLGVAVGLLTQPAWAEYEKVTQQALDEYEKVRQQALDEYEKVTQQAQAEYLKVTQQALDEYDKVTRQAWAEYDKVTWQAQAEYNKVTWQAQAEYNKVRQPARAEYNKVRQPVWVKYLKVRQQAFWDLFAIPLNRNPLWR